MPLRISPNGVDNHAAPNPVPSRDLGGQTGQRHKCIHKAWVEFTPEPSVHSAHGGSDHEAQMIHLYSFGEQSVLRFEHVAIAVSRKFCVERIAWLAGLAVAE